MKPRLNINWGVFFGSFLPVVIILSIVLYILFFQQTAINNFLVKYDSIGITSVGAKEKARLRTINNLNIPFEQRNALANRTVFIGASEQMVELALGSPTATPSEEGSQVRWTYFFEEHSRPIYLYFEGGSLVNAEKGSTLDTAVIQ